MKPPQIPLEKITALDPIYRLTVPEDFRDENGHMNVRHYVGIFDDAGYPMMETVGINWTRHTAENTGGFDLEHHIHYLNEVYIGDEVVVYARFINRSAKRVHYIMFMVNQTRGKLAAIFECINSYADMSVRKTEPYPPDIVAKIDTLVASHQALEWEPPLSGIMQA
jgi:acyl-CoA thioester hydrolase